MIVLDTNVVSELMRPQPSAEVVVWLTAQDAPGLRTTAITVAEISYGIRRLPRGRRRDGLAAIAGELFAGFSDQVLAFDEHTAERYAEIVVQRDRAGRPIDGFDAQIAAICLSHQATLATRNTRDFEHTGITTIDPWAT